MFTAIPESIIEELVDEFKLDDYDKMIIQTYLKDFLLTLAEKVNKKSGG